MAASLCVCVFVFLVGLSARASSQALSYSSDSDSYNCSWATDRARERRMGERGTGNGEPLLTPKYWHWRQNAFELSIYTNLIRLPLPIPKKTSSESCEMHLLLKLISTLGLSWVSAQHEMPEFVGGCASAFNQLQICKYLLNWLTLSVERFFVLNLKKVPPHATVQRGRNSKSFAILPQPRPKKPQEFRSTQQWKTAVIWQWLTVALCLSLFLSLSVYQFN